MKAVRIISFAVALLLGIGMSMLPVYSSSAATAPAQPTVTNEDCIKCHAAPPADIAAAGGKHAGVGCGGCHIGIPRLSRTDPEVLPVSHGQAPFRDRRLPQLS